jgi:hypothetical protein
MPARKPTMRPVDAAMVAVGRGFIEAVTAACAVAGD